MVFKSAFSFHSRKSFEVHDIVLDPMPLPFTKHTRDEKKSPNVYVVIHAMGWKKMSTQRTKKNYETELRNVHFMLTTHVYHVRYETTSRITKQVNKIRVLHTDDEPVNHTH